MRSTMGSLLSGLAWRRAQSGSFVNARPNSRSRPAMSALSPTRSNHCSINAVSSLYCRTCSIGVWANAIGRPSASSRSPPPPASFVLTGEIDFAAVQGCGVGERARAEPPDIVHPNHLQLHARPERPGQRVALETVGRQEVLHEEHGRRITCDGKRSPRTVSSMRHLLSKCGMPVRWCADPTDV